MFDKRRLSNGIVVVTDDMKYMNSISMGIYVGCGSRYENEHNNGMAHYIEHMLFKGTHKRSAAELAFETDELGGQLNAYTSKEYTCFYFKVLSEHLKKALDIVSDMLLNSKFDREDIKRERTVIDEEISIYEDTPEDLVFDRLQYDVWGRKNLGLEILGTHSSISKFTREDFLEYMSNNYRTDNIVISAAGRFDREELYSMLENAFGGIKAVSYRSNAEKAVYTPSAVKTVRDIEQVHLCMAFPAFKTEERSYGLSVLNSAVGGGMSSRLFQKIREEKGLCYSVYSTFSTYMDAGIFMIYMGLSASNLEKAINICESELERLKTGGIGEEELLRVKGQLKSAFLMQDESTSAKCARIGRNMLLTGRYRSNEEALSLLEKVDNKEIKEISNIIFNKNLMSISIVGREKGINLQNIINA